MLLEFFEITLGLITISLLFFLLYTFLGSSRRVQAKKTTRAKTYEQFKNFEQEFGDDDSADVEEALLSDNEFVLSDDEDGVVGIVDNSATIVLDDNEPGFKQPLSDFDSEGGLSRREAIINKADPLLANTPKQHMDSKIADSRQSNIKLDVNEPIIRHISLFILANGNKKFQGYELLQALLASGLRFGDMNIFHRHEESNGTGRVLFSLASATEPGTFNIQNMGSFSGKGLCLFMRLYGTERDNEIFDLFIKTAQKLADELNGSVYDDSRHPLTKDTLVRFHQILRAAKKESQPFELADA